MERRTYNGFLNSSSMLINDKLSPNVYIYSSCICLSLSDIISVGPGHSYHNNMPGCKSYFIYTMNAISPCRRRNSRSMAKESIRILFVIIVLLLFTGGFSYILASVDSCSVGDIAIKYRQDVGV